MEKEIKNIYKSLTGGKEIKSKNFIISQKDFTSILLTRFNSELQKRKIYWDGEDIKFKELLNSKANLNQKKKNIDLIQNDYNKLTKKQNQSIGLDIQLIDDFPDSIDFTNDDFYIKNFTKKEISYCKIKLNPKESFAGIFSAKESIFKSDNNYNLDDIEVFFDKNGRPVHDNFLISISHSNKYAVSFAIPKEIINNKIDLGSIIEKLNNNNELLDLNKSIRSNQKNIRLIKYSFFVILILGILYFSTIIKY